MHNCGFDVDAHNSFTLFPFRKVLSLLFVDILVLSGGSENDSLMPDQKTQFTKSSVNEDISTSHLYDDT